MLHKMITIYQNIHLPIYCIILKITYKRSKEHLNDLIDTLCEGQMSDYAQARWKDTKEPTIIRIMSHEGGMNPDFGLVDVIPDEDLNKRLQFYVSRILRKSRIVLNAQIL